MQKSFLISVAVVVLAGAIGYFLYTSRPVPVQTVDQITKTSQVPALPTSFRVPAPDGTPHIVGAEIEHMTVPDCQGCDVEFFKKIDGIDEGTLLYINERLTQGIFNENDIRDPQKRIVSSDAEVDDIENKILYVDKGFISTYSSFEIFFKDTAHPSREPGSYDFIEINPSSDSTNGPVIFNDDLSYTNQDKVLSHFYPNGKELLDKYVEENDDSENSCYGDVSFPENFWPKFRPNTREIVYSVLFPYANIGPCSPGLEIAIPLDDVLSQVPEFVPKQSVLWKFKK